VEPPKHEGPRHRDEVRRPVRREWVTPCLGPVGPTGDPGGDGIHYVDPYATAV